jgi:hypothetical protein
VKIFVEKAFDSDITLVNYPQIDYFLKDLSNAAGYEEKTAPRFGSQKFKSFFFVLASNRRRIFGFEIAKRCRRDRRRLGENAYVRESRRIRAEFTVCEQHVSAARRPNEIFAEKFDDSVGVGFYRIDLHPTVGGDNYLDVEALPFQIPLGALIPQTTKICSPRAKTSARRTLQRMLSPHPIEWNIGEAAGALAAFCLGEKCETVGGQKRREAVTRISKFAGEKRRRTRMAKGFEKLR